jgi:hypothetical protein
MCFRAGHLNNLVKFYMLYEKCLSILLTVKQNCFTVVRAYKGTSVDLPHLYVYSSVFFKRTYNKELLPF